MFVDTATLYPISVADLVVRPAEPGMFELVWSEHKGLPVDRTRYLCDCIRDA